MAQLQAGQTSQLRLLTWVGAARPVDAGRPSWAALALGLMHPRWLPP